MSKLTDIECRKRGAQIAANLPNNVTDACRILQYAADIMRFVAGQTEGIQQNAVPIPVHLDDARREAAGCSGT